MKNSSLISVIIPTYNQESYIAAAIDSVLEQRLPAGYRLEIIVADDDSTDGTAKVVKTYGQKVRFKKMVHTGKPASTRNAALRLAKGELIAFLDGDDLWVKDKLAAQLKVFDDSAVMLSFGNAIVIDADGKPTGSTVVKASELKGGEKFQSLVEQNVISTLTVMVRRQALEVVGNFNEADRLFGAEDYELWLRILAKFPKGAKALDKTLGEYRVHANNISAGNHLQAIERLLNIYNSVWETQLSAARRAKLESIIFKMHENWGRLHSEMHPEVRPTVSVIMGMYNNAKYLKQSVKSILDQSFKDFEFIVIDDGSTDGSAAVIESFKDKRIRLVRQRNHGLAYSLNQGIKLARGKYIARQDADDISMPERLAKQVALLDKDSRLGLVGTFFTYVDEATKQPGLTICMPTKSLDIKRAMYATNPIGHGTAMIRREVFNDINPYTDKYGSVEDFELWRRIIDHWEAAIVPESLYAYLLNPEGISHNSGREQHRATAKVIAEQWAKPLFFKPARDIIRDGRYYKKLPLGARIYDQYTAQQIDIAKSLLGRGNLKSGLRTAYGAWRLRPSSFKLFIKPVLRGTMKRLGIRR